MDPFEVGVEPFVPAFTFSFPAEAEFDYGSVNETYFDVRVPAFADAGMPSGVIVQAIGAGRADPCDAASEPLEIDPGPQSVIDYLKTIPDLAVTDEAPTTVGGLPAVQATVTGAGDTLACDEIYAWVEGTEIFSAIPLDGPRRLVAVDAGSEHIVLTVFGEDGNPSWPQLAAELIDSIIRLITSDDGPVLSKVETRSGLLPVAADLSIVCRRATSARSGGKRHRSKAGATPRRSSGVAVQPRTPTGCLHGHCHPGGHSGHPAPEPAVRQPRIERAIQTVRCLNPRNQSLSARASPGPDQAQRVAVPISAHWVAVRRSNRRLDCSGQRQAGE